MISSFVFSEQGGNVWQEKGSGKEGSEMKEGCEVWYNLLVWKITDERVFY